MFGYGNYSTQNYEMQLDLLPHFILKNNSQSCTSVNLSTETKKRPLLITQQRAWCLDIESYFDVLPAVDSAAGGEGVEVLLCILSRQGEGGEHQEVRS